MGVFSFTPQETHGMMQKRRFAMKPVKLPDIDYLRSRLRYDKWNGTLTWLDRTVPVGKEYMSGEVKRWNTRFAGKRAGVESKAAGYWVICIDGKQYKYHRICYALGTRNCDFGMIDHISGDTSDNRFRNLRETDAKGNARNAKLCSRNKSGFKGVLQKGNMFSAYISTDDGRVHLGTFQTKKDAVLARQSAEAKNNYHRNHGRDLGE